MTENEIHEEFIKIQANNLKKLIAELEQVTKERDYLADQLDKLAPQPYESWLEFVKEYVK